MDELMLKLKILTRAELTLARANLRRLAIRTSLAVVAIGMVLLMVVMFNVGIYDVLAARHGNATAAFMVAGGNGLLALILFFIGNSIRPGPEQEMVREIREMALAELAEDASQIQKDFTELGADVQRIRDGFGAFTDGGGTVLTSLAPLVSLALDALKHRKG
jgi:hypothetical protein